MFAQGSVDFSIWRVGVIKLLLVVPHTKSILNLTAKVESVLYKTYKHYAFLEVTILKFLDILAFKGDSIRFKFFYIALNHTVASRRFIL